MRPIAVALVLLTALACTGCFEVYNAGISVHAGNTPSTWTTAETPEIAFTVSNDHVKPIDGITVHIHLEVLSGLSPESDSTMSLSTTPAGVTGDHGTWRIAGLASGKTVVLTPKIFYEPGTYRLTATIAPEGSLTEHSTKDNVSTVTFSVTAAPAVDGLNLSVAAPTAMTPSGDTIALSVPVTVVGGTAHLVRIDVHTQGATTFWYHYNAFVNPGTQTVQLKAAPPPGGSGNIRIDVDPGNYIPESSETDNSVVFAYPAGASG